MATAIAATTLVPASAIASRLKVAVVSLQAPSSYTTGGDALDVSGTGLEGVYGMVFGATGAASDNAYRFGLTGTYSSTEKSYSSSATKLTAHMSAGTATVFTEFTSTGDLSAINDMTVVCFGH